MADDISSNDSESSDDFLDNCCYMVGVIVALIGLFVLILSILADAPEFAFLYEHSGGFPDHDFLMPGAGLMMYGMVIFFSGTMGVPFLMPISYRLIFINNKFVRVFEILSGIFVILIYFFWAVMVILSWI